MEGRNLSVVNFSTDLIGRARTKIINLGDGFVFDANIDISEELVGCNATAD